VTAPGGLPGAIRLPDGAWVRGRGLRRPPPPGPAPDFGLYLGTRRLRAGWQPPWPHEWVAWPDFRLPSDPDAAVAAIRALHRRALAGELVEVACGGGVGRTGTVIACLAVLASTPGETAVGWTRDHYHPRAVETPGQRRWVLRFGSSQPGWAAGHTP
jgi:hypothetical protein